MAIETDTERAVLLADFGVSATYTAEGQSATTITVVFDEPYIGVDPDGKVAVESANPSCIAKTSDVSNANHAATIVISGTTYTVIGVQPDGTGFTVLDLQA